MRSRVLMLLSLLTLLLLVGVAAAQEDDAAAVPFIENPGACDETLLADECELYEAAVSAPLNTTYDMQVSVTMETQVGRISSTANTVAIEGPVELNADGEIVRADLRARTITTVSVMFGGNSSMLVDEVLFRIRPDRIYVGAVAFDESVTWTYVDRSAAAMQDASLNINSVFPTAFFDSLAFDKAWYRLEDSQDDDGTVLQVYKFAHLDEEPVTGFNTLEFFVAPAEEDAAPDDPALSLMSGLASVALAATYPSVTEYAGFVGVNQSTGELDQFITRQIIVVDTTREPNPTLNTDDPTIYDLDLSGLEEMLGNEVYVTYRVAVNFNAPRTEIDEELPESEAMPEVVGRYLGLLGQSGAVQMIAGYMMSQSPTLFTSF